MMIKRPYKVSVVDKKPYNLSGSRKPSPIFPLRGLGVGGAIVILLILFLGGLKSCLDSGSVKQEERYEVLQIGK